MPISETLAYDSSDNNPGQENPTTNDKIYDSIIMPYLFGAQVIEIRHRLSSPTTPVKQDFQDCPIQNDPDNRHFGYHDKALKILITLGITDFEQQRKYLDAKNCNNVYQLLCHLYRDGHHHLATLIDMIDQSTPKRYMLKFALPTALISIMVAGGAIWDRITHNQFKRIASKVMDGLELFIQLVFRIVNSARNVAYIGMGINLATFLYEVLVTSKDDKRNVKSKLYDLSFALGASLLTILSYVITVLTNGALSTVAAWLFVCASAVAVAKAISSLRLAIIEFNAYKKNFSNKHGGMSIKEAIKENKVTLQEQAQYFRTLYHYRARRMALIQEIATSITVLLVVASWTFALLFPPGSVALIAVSIAMLTLIQTLHSYFSEKSKNYYDDELQKHLCELDQNNLKAEIAPEYAKIPSIINELCSNPSPDNTQNITKGLNNDEQTSPKLNTPSPLASFEIEKEYEPLSSSTLVSSSKSTLSSWFSFPRFFNTDAAKPSPVAEERQALLEETKAQQELEDSHHKLD